MLKVAIVIMWVGFLFGVFCGLFAGYAALSHEPEEYQGVNIVSIFVPWAILTGSPFYLLAIVVELLHRFLKWKL